MRLLKLLPHYSKEELAVKLHHQKTASSYIKWQIIYSIQNNPDQKASVYSSYLGVKISFIYQVVSEYNKYGKDWNTEDKRGGRREERCLLTLSEEKELLNNLEQEALEGKILTFKDLKQVVELKLRRTVSDDYIWDLFKRHNWSKKSPRPTHPEGNEEERKSYKKTSHKHWRP